jgi:hypothetical protein
MASATREAMRRSWRRGRSLRGLSGRTLDQRLAFVGGCGAIGLHAGEREVGKAAEDRRNPSALLSDASHDILFLLLSMVFAACPRGVNRRQGRNLITLS